MWTSDASPLSQFAVKERMSYSEWLASSKVTGLTMILYTGPGATS